MFSTLNSMTGRPVQVMRRTRLSLTDLFTHQTARTLMLAAVLAIGTSTQYFAQLFVWREWPLQDVLEGWLFVLRDRFIVALAIALALIIHSLGRSRSLARRTGSLAVAVLVGSASGEWGLGLLYGGQDDWASWISRSLRFAALALAVAATYYLWRASVESRESLRREDLRRLSVEQQLTNTRLIALRKQIEPHFLFNTLATVRRLHQTSPESGAEMLANFIDYLARLLPMLEKSEVFLAEEVDLVQAYLAVIQLRMLDRLKVRIDVPENLRRAHVPPLALATLVENAVKHGIAPLQLGGVIEVLARTEAGMMEIGVRDNGKGLKAESAGGSGIGLYNVRARLQTLHGSRALLVVEPNHPTGVCSYMRMPLKCDP
jgi:two-component sensor histidine kinase